MFISHFQQGKDEKGDGKGDSKDKDDKEEKDKAPKNRRRTERFNGRATTPRSRGVKGL
jgi:hypothetical protein